MDAPAPSPPPVALCLGGMDPSGGAGLLRDAATLGALGVHAMAVTTAETLQNGLGCARIEPPGLDPLERLEALRGHLAGAWGLKLGMCALPLAAVEALAARIADLAPPVRIWDPILAPTSGPALHGPGALLDLARAILGPGGWVVAPNRLEAAAAASEDPDGDPRRLAAPFLARGARAVWLKGGHGGGSSVEDHWVTPEGSTGLGLSPRLPGSVRGTGCTLASAWLAFRLRGAGDLPAAVQAAAWLRARWGGAFAPGGLGRPVFAPGGAP